MVATTARVRPISPYTIPRLPTRVVCSCVLSLLATVAAWVLCAPLASAQRGMPVNKLNAPTGTSMNIVWLKADANGLPFDPEWSWQSTYGTAPNAERLCSSAACTSQPYNVNSWLPCDLFGSGTAFGGTAGHVNFTPPTGRAAPTNATAVTYGGPVIWEDYGGRGAGGLVGGLGLDRDYTFAIKPPPAYSLAQTNSHKFTSASLAGLATSSNAHGGLTSVGMHFEFDASESIWQFRDQWWRTFRNAVQTGDPRNPRSTLSDHSRLENS